MAKSIRLLFSKSAADNAVESGAAFGFRKAVADDGTLFKFTADQLASEEMKHPGLGAKVDDFLLVSELRVVEDDGQPVNDKSWGKWGYASPVNC